MTAFGDYFNPISNTLHHRPRIMLSSYEQKTEQSSQQFIRNLHELVGKFDFNANQEPMVIKTRLPDGLRDQQLSRDLLLDPQVTSIAIGINM